MLYPLSYEGVVFPAGWTAGCGRRFSGLKLGKSGELAAFYQSKPRAGGGLFTKFFFSLD